MDGIRTHTSHFERGFTLLELPRVIFWQYNLIGYGVAIFVRQSRQLVKMSQTYIPPLVCMPF